MRIAVRTPDAIREVECDFAQQFDSSIVEDWAGAVSEHSSALQIDAAEFCESAWAKWTAYAQRKRVARSQAELLANCKDDQKAEILGILWARAPWIDNTRVLAFCLFRRSWSNNIVFDFLAVHPLLQVKPSPISGLGSALLYRLAVIAQTLNVNCVWAETTSTSVTFYEKLFGLNGLQDLLVVTGKTFHETLREAFAGRVAEKA